MSVVRELQDLGRSDPVRRASRQLEECDPSWIHKTENISMATISPPAESSMRLHPESEKEQLRVLAVIPGDGRGFNFSRRQVLSLTKLGVEVRTFFLLSRTSPLLLIDCLRELRKIIRRFRPHVLHAHYGTVTSVFCALSGNTPLVITFQGSDLQGSLNLVRSTVGKMLSQFASLRATEIVCVSPALRDRLWWRRDRVHIVPTGIDLDLFRPYPKDMACKRLGWDPTMPIVLFSGADRPVSKGLPIVEQALQVTKKLIGPVQFHSLSTFAYPFELMPYCLSAADCLAMASVSEGSPNIVKEALACNLPIVSTDVGDIADRIKGVHPSMIVARDSITIGRAIAEILSLKCRSNGRDRANLWSETDAARVLVSIYNSIRINQARATTVLV